MFVTTKKRLKTSVPTILITNEYGYINKKKQINQSKFKEVQIKCLILCHKSKTILNH